MKIKVCCNVKCLKPFLEAKDGKCPYCGCNKFVEVPFKMSITLLFPTGEAPERHYAFPDTIIERCWEKVLEVLCEGMTE